MYAQDQEQFLAAQHDFLLRRNFHVRLVGLRWKRRERNEFGARFGCREIEAPLDGLRSLRRSLLLFGLSVRISEGIVGEGRRLSRLVENLLDISRLEAGKAEPHRGPVDLAEVLEAALRGQGKTESIRLSVDAELPMVDADAAQLERAFANLLENAVRYGNGRPVLVRSRLVGGNIVVRVVDQGPGIPEGDRDRIFEPFQHGETTSAGSGLGLAIAKGFIEANGGGIAVESLPGQGTSFVVTLPPHRREA